MSTLSLSEWIKCITGHNKHAYFQSKGGREINPHWRLCGSTKSETILYTCIALNRENDTMRVGNTSCLSEVPHLLNDLLSGDRTG